MICQRLLSNKELDDWKMEWRMGLSDSDGLARPKAPPMVRKKLRPEVTTARSGAAVVLSAATRATEP
jgi:hypothetical protein